MDFVLTIVMSTEFINESITKSDVLMQINFNKIW